MSKYLVSYATILALRKNIDETKFETKESYVNQFNHALKDIEQEVGAEIFSSDDFSINPEYIKKTLMAYNPINKQSQYSKDKYCETRLLLTKIDAALNYLQLIAPEEDKQKMGF
jgi:hypothetical protein